jgi:hypothetical protein
VYASRRWVRSNRKGTMCVLHLVSYKCSWSFRGRLHSKNAEVELCDNPQIKAELLEGRVLFMVREIMLDPLKLRTCVNFFKEDARAVEQRAQQELRAIDGQRAALEEKKRRIIDIYASGDLSRDAYVEKSREFDGLMETLRRRGKELGESTALLHKSEAIEVAIVQFCAAAVHISRNVLMPRALASSCWILLRRLSL